VAGATARGARTDERQAAREVVNAVLFREILKPLAQGLGPIGETALGTVVDRLFVRRPG
jgi:DNA topoisomerase VI subunit B